MSQARIQDALSILPVDLQILTSDFLNRSDATNMSRVCHELKDSVQQSQEWKNKIITDCPFSVYEIDDIIKKYESPQQAYNDLFTTTQFCRKLAEEKQDFIKDADNPDLTMLNVLNELFQDQSKWAFHKRIIALGCFLESQGDIEYFVKEVNYFQVLSQYADERLHLILALHDTYSLARSLIVTRDNFIQFVLQSRHSEMIRAALVKKPELLFHLTHIANSTPLNSLKYLCEQLHLDHIALIEFMIQSPKLRYNQNLLGHLLRINEFFNEDESISREFNLLLQYYLTNNHAEKAAEKFLKLIINCQTDLCLGDMILIDSADEATQMRNIFHAVPNGSELLVELFSKIKNVEIPKETKQKKEGLKQVKDFCSDRKILPLIQADIDLVEKLKSIYDDESLNTILDQDSVSFSQSRLRM